MADARTQQPGVFHAGGDHDKARGIIELVKRLLALPDMDKRTMSGSCHPQTTRMEEFMQANFGFRNVPGYFVDGVRKFVLDRPVADKPDDDVLTFCDAYAGGKPAPPAGGNTWSASAAEVRRWQSTFRVYYASDIYKGEEGKAEIAKALGGLSEAGEEAWKVKFAARISVNPVLCTFNGRVLKRDVGQEVLERIHMVSVSGVDFAGRKHDVDDVRMYLKNWQKVYALGPDGNPIVFGGRDFCPRGVRGEVNEPLLLAHLQKMARVRLRALNDMRVQVVGETGIGLGVFSGDYIGIGEVTRRVSVQALRSVLEEEEFPEIQLVVVALPVFRRKDNFFYFKAGFEGYRGRTPVLLLDQDMHNVAVATAYAGYRTSELNPADSHGVVGEYWQNRGPGTEEKLALTTTGLLTQHHAVNPHVLDTRNYVPIDDTHKPRKAPPKKVEDKPPEAAVASAATADASGAGAGAGASGAGAGAGSATAGPEEVADDTSAGTDGAEEAPTSSGSPIVDVMCAVAEAAEESAITQIFVYGTLRDDATGHHAGSYTAEFVAEASGKDAFLVGYKMYQAPGQAYPFIVHTGHADDRVFGRVLSWSTTRLFASRLKRADVIEGYDPSSNTGLYLRKPVTVLLHVDGRPMARTQAFVYVQGSGNVASATHIDGGDWLNRAADK